MKQITYIFTLLAVVMCACQEQEAFQGVEQIPSTPQGNANNQSNNSDGYYALVSTLKYTNWATVDNLYDWMEIDTNNGNIDYIRNSFISIFDSKIASSATDLQAISINEDLAGLAHCYHFLLKASIRTEAELSNMTISDIINTITQENQNNTSHSLTFLQTRSHLEKAQIANGWWLTSNIDFSHLLNQIGRVDLVPSTERKFDLKDIHQNEIDVLRIEETQNLNQKYVGIYHTHEGAGHFKLRLAWSNNLIDWTPLRVLVDHAHQGDIKAFGNGFLVAYEKTVVVGSSNKIELAYYDSYDDLKDLNYTPQTVRIDRIHGTTAEGTPDIRSISGNSITDSKIEIGFHYYTSQTDRLAYGILKDFNANKWKTWKDWVSNKNILDMAYQHQGGDPDCATVPNGGTFEGKIGGRKTFEYNSKTYVLQEAQGLRMDGNDNNKCVWQSWRLLLGDGAFYHEIDIITPNGAFSFANPGITKIGNEYVITAFLPSENRINPSDNTEKGDMLYKVTF